MSLRQAEARPSVLLGGALINQKHWCAMSNRMYGALIASLGAIALIMCAGGETLAAAPRGMTSNHPHSNFHSPFARLHRHHHNNRNDDFGAVAWPDEGFFGGPGLGGGDFSPPIPNDIRNTNAFDIPWDWAHRYPPMVTPSAKPYVSTCPTETVKVPSFDGREQTVNITRCY